MENLLEMMRYASDNLISDDTVREDLLSGERSYNDIRNRILFRLFPREDKSTEILHTLPFLDTKVVFFISASDTLSEDSDCMCYGLPEAVFEILNVSKVQLFKDALENTERMYKTLISSDGKNYVQLDECDSLTHSLYFLTGQRQYCGASMIVNPKTMDEIAIKAHSDFLVWMATEDNVILCALDAEDMTLERKLVKLYAICEGMMESERFKDRLLSQTIWYYHKNRHEFTKAYDVPELLRYTKE